MNQMLRQQIIFQYFVLILCLVGQPPVSGFWPLLCPFGCMYFFFLLPRVTVQSSYVTIRQKICRLCFQETSHITRDTELPGPLNNTYFKLQLRILTYYSPFTLLVSLVTTICTKCFFLFSICVKQN